MVCHIGKIDIAGVIMTMGRFRTAPTINHWAGLVQILGYLREHLDRAIRFCMEMPPHEHMLKVKVEDWMKTVYGDCKEQIPADAPVPKGCYVRTTTWVAAALNHCKATGTL